MTAAAPAAGVVDSVIALVYSCRHHFAVRPPSVFLKIQLIMTRILCGRQCHRLYNLLQKNFSKGMLSTKNYTNK